MSNPVCTRETLLTNGCFAGAVLNDTERKSLKIYLMALQLAAIGGTDYTAVLSTTLINDSKCKETTNDDQMKTMALQIEANNATSAGATVSTNINTLMAGIRCLKNATNRQLMAAELHLRCQLGRAKAYPQ